MGTSSENDFSGGEPFYLSTTRTLSGFYERDIRHASSAGYVVLDGQKLMADGFTGKPIDYWGPSFRTTRPDKFESEDRIFSDKPAIPNAVKYITEIHLYANLDKMDKNQDTGSEKQKSKIRKIIIAAKKNNIPVSVYDNADAYNSRNKAKALTDLSRLKSDSSVDTSDRYHGITVNYLKPYVELLSAPLHVTLSKDARRIKNNILDHPWHVGDHVRSLDSTIHNSRKKNMKSNEFTVLCKKLGLRKSADIIEYIRKKYDEPKQ